MKKSLKILSAFLAVLTFFSILSAATPVFAEDVNEYIADKEYTEKLLTEVVENNTEEKAPIVKEIEEKRDENKKVYLREDGTYTAVISKTPVHYEKDGEWVDIVNDLKTDGDVITNTAGNFNVEFPKEISEDNEIKVENGKESLTFSIAETEKSNGKVKNNKKQKQDKNKVSDEEIFNNDISRNVSEIEYEDVLENTNLEYVVTPTGVKENIIVENKESLKKSYSFNITKGKLKAELDKENNLYFKNSKGEVVFTIPAPVMTDSNGAISYDIDVKVKNLKKETITLTYTPDKKWLNDKDRAYPIAIDPVIMLESNREFIIQDTVIGVDTTDSESATKNGYNDFIGAVAYNREYDENSILQTLRYDVLVKLNMDIFSTLKKPSIAITNVNYVTAGSAQNGNILAKEISGSWDSTTITGTDVYPQLAGSDNSATISYGSTILDYYSGIDTQTENTPEILTFNITSLFQKWLSGEKINNGFALTTEDEGCVALAILGGKYTNRKGKTTYYSSYCTVDYIEASGYNSNFEYLSQDIGRAGTFNVNTFARSLSIYREDLSMPGNIMPVTVGFNYSSALINYLQWYTDFASAIDEEQYLFYSPYGNKWTPNYLKMLFTLDEIEYYYFTETGSMAIFTPKEEAILNEDGTDSGNTKTVFETNENGEIGYELALIDETNSTDFNNMVITTPTGETEYFNEDGFITEIREAEPNPNGTYDKIVISYEDYTTLEADLGLPKIDYINDGVGRKYDFVYTNDKLSHINCLTSTGAQIYAGTGATSKLKINYNIDTNNNLTSVVYQDSKSVTYTYDSSGNLTNARNIDAYNITYTYDSLGKVTKINEKANTTQGNSIALSAIGNRQTKIVDNYQGTQIQQFGSDGKLTYIFDDKGNFYRSSNCKNADENVSVNSGWDVAPINILRNGAFERTALSKPTGWTNTFKVQTVDNNNACKVTGTDTQTQSAAVSGSKAYTFSIYAKDISDSNIENTGFNIEIKALYSTTKTKTETLWISPTEDYEQYSVTVVAPTEITLIRVYIGGDNTVGEFLVDNAQLEAGYGTSKYNYIENGNFMYELVYWSGGKYEKYPNKAATFKRNLELTTSDYIKGVETDVLKYYSELPVYDIVDSETVYSGDTYYSATQTVEINGEKEDIFSLGGWFKGEFTDGLLSEKVQNSFDVTYEPVKTRVAQIKASYTYTDENGVTQNEDFAVNFSPNVQDWQYANDSFALKGDVENIDVTVITKNIPTNTYFTNISLVKDEDSFFVGDFKSELEETISASSISSEKCSCSNCNNLACSCTCESEINCTCETCKIVSCICEDCEDIECLCRCLNETNCTCVSCKRQSNIETTSADAKTVTTQTYNGGQYMQSSVSYTNDLNNISSETDENNITTSYTYAETGAITSSTDGNNIITNYQNDAMGYLKLAQTNVSNLSDNKTKISLAFNYNNDLLSTITTDDVVYTYTYDDWRQIKSVSVDNQKLIQYNYGDKENRSRINSIEHLIDKDTNTKYSLNYVYNEYDKITQVKKNTVTNDGNNNGIVYNYYYDNLGHLIAIDDSKTGRTIRYSANGDTTIEATGKNDVIYKAYYNEDGEFCETIDNGTYTAKSYDSSYSASTGDTTQKEAVVSTKNSTTKTLSVTTVTDWFGRNKTVTVSTNNPTQTATTNDVSIVSGNVYKSYDSDKTTNLIATNRNTISYNGVNRLLNIVYTYDENGRITSRRNAGSLATDLVEYNTYAYDEAGQLIRENKSTQKTWVYEYDANGNITKRKAYNYTPSTPSTLVSTDMFTYATDTWEDRLVSYNGQNIVYDNIGNPTTYLGAVLTWRGRELANYTKDTTSIDYSYDVDRMRYQKVVKTNGTETSRYNYVYSDDQLILLSCTTNGTTQNAKFVYDLTGEVRGFVVNGTTQYFYVKNPQGDIVAIVNESGVPVVRYIYDAWGNTTITTDSGYENLINLSPFAYRSYCYDNDIKMYYLQSRYYDPQICRFINADSSEYLGATGTVLSCNLFAYCENDPMDYIDPKGNVKNSDIIISRGPGKWENPFSGDDDYVYDPNAIPYETDFADWYVWGMLQEKAAKLYPEGAAFYQHYRSNKGGLYFYDYSLAYKQDWAIKQAVNKLVKKLKKSADSYRKYNDTWYTLSTNLVHVQPTTMNWLLAVGGHRIGVVADIIYNSKQKKYEMEYWVIAIDRYNFDANGKAFFGIKDEYNGRFVTLGWAKFFTSIGLMGGKKTWRS